MKPAHFALAGLLAMSVVSSAPAQSPSSDGFRIELRTDVDGISMRCTSGCAWKTLTVGCSTQEPCGFVLDQNGMGE